MPPPGDLQAHKPRKRFLEGLERPEMEVPGLQSPRRIDSQKGSQAGKPVVDVPGPRIMLPGHSGGDN